MKQTTLRQQAWLTFIGQVERVEGDTSRIKLRSEFCEGLHHLQDFSHIIVLGWFSGHDKMKDRLTIKVTPKRHPGAPEVGVFGSRSPCRPNPIGLSVVQLLDLEGCTVIVKGLDFMEGTPVIDIKPYLPRADLVAGARAPMWTQRGPPT